MRRLAHTSAAGRLILGAIVAALAVTRATMAPAVVAARTESDVRRVLTLLAAVGEEYREGVQDGAVVRPIEWEEAKGFLDEARHGVQSLVDGPGRAELDASLTQAAAGIDGKASPETVGATLAAVRERLMTLSGVSEEVYPPEPPSAGRGMQLFAQYCVTCHGERGDGKGPSAAGLHPPPANFTDAQFIRGETPYDFYHVISLGKRGTAMPAWDGVLSVQDRWDLISYLWTLAPGSDNLAEGQGIYLLQCASCHGATGNGQGAWSAALMKPAPNLSQPQALARRSDAALFAATTDGIAASPMPSFARVLRDDERWKLVAFMRLLSHGGPTSTANTAGGEASGKRFGGLLRLLGREYGRAWTGEQLTNTIEYNEASALTHQMTDIAAELGRGGAADQATRLRDGAAAIAALVREQASPAQVSAAAEELALLGEAIAPGPMSASSTASASDDTLNEASRLLDAAVAASDRGDGGAASLAGDAYLQFEPLEQKLGAVDTSLKTRIEERFLQLRQRLRSSRNPADAQALAAAIHADFAAARRALQPHTSPYALFFESATIILREGFEIVLVIGALIAYVVKTGNAAMRRSIYAGTAAGVVASLITAAAMGELLRLHPGSSDTLEGITMLLAAVVLFWVSYWLISKAEADKWQRYIRGKVQHALSGGSGAALAGAAFLAVYREGFETVLFYQALYASAPAASMTVTAGFLTGAVALAIVYGAFRRFQVQIPIRQFFFVTGLLLYLMAAIFAGQGIHELQEAALLPMTPVAWVPAIPLLGIFPSLESLALQALFVGLLVYATLVTVRRARPVPIVDETAPELRALRGALDALRHEIEALRSTETAALPAAVEDRVESLVVRVEELAGRVGGKPLVDGQKH